MVAYFIHHEILFVLFATGLIAGTVDAIAGGGGLISLPILLGVGVPPHLALGTNKLQGMVGTAVATHAYYQQGWVKKQGLWRGLLWSFCGALLGAISSQILSGQLLRKVIPILLLCVLIYIVFSPRLGGQDEEPKMSEGMFYAIFGTLLGFYDGFLGPGAGSFWMFVLVFFLGHNLLKATAYTKVFNLNTNIAAVLCFALGGNISYSLALCMAAGQIIGGKVGAKLAIRNGVKLVRPVFILMVTATIIVLIFKNYATSAMTVLWLQEKNMILSIIGIMVILAVLGLWRSNYVTNKKN